MAGARLQDCAKWLARGWSQRNGSEWPQLEKATIKRHLRDCAGQLKNCGVAIDGQRQQKKNCGAAIDGSHRPTEKIAARQSRDHAGQQKK
jgi:hypothetical protein